MCYGSAISWQPRASLDSLLPSHEPTSFASLWLGAIGFLFFVGYQMALACWWIYYLSCFVCQMACRTSGFVSLQSNSRTDSIAFLVSSVAVSVAAVRTNSILIGLDFSYFLFIRSACWFVALATILRYWLIIWLFDYLIIYIRVWVKVTVSDLRRGNCKLLICIFLPQSPVPSTLQAWTSRWKPHGSSSSWWPTPPNDRGRKGQMGARRPPPPPPPPPPATSTRQPTAPAASPAASPAGMVAVPATAARAAMTAMAAMAAMAAGRTAVGRRWLTHWRPSLGCHPWY